SLYAQSNQTIKGAVHTKVRRVSSRFRELPRDREVIVYCACPADEAAIIGARDLRSNGFQRVRVLKGGWYAWLKAGGPVQPRPR
ncbi:MAG: rhodanese-like domain-containing protein, partial [Blastocatellia bacterium]